MVLNYIWIAFFLIGFIVALGQLIFAGNTQIFNELVNSVFLMQKRDLKFHWDLPVH